MTAGRHLAFSCRIGIIGEALRPALGLGDIIYGVLLVNLLSPKDDSLHLLFRHR
jgi:hypothetical protein